MNNVIKHIVLLICFIPLLSFSQEKSRKFIIDIGTDRAIPFATVTNLSKGKKWVADVNGSFAFYTDSISMTDEFLFEAKGYSSKKMPYLLFKDTSLIKLKLREIFTEIILEKIKDLENLKIGDRHKINTSEGIDLNKEVAVKLLNCDTLSGLIENINFFLYSFSGEALEINIYKNSSNGFPGKKINDEPILMMPHGNMSWHEISILNWEIKIPEQGFFISFRPINEGSKKSSKLGVFREKINGNTYVNEGTSWSLTNKYVPAVYVNVKGKKNPPQIEEDN